MNPYMFFDFTGPTAFWALGESKLCQQTKTQFENDEYASNLDDFQILLQELEFSKSYRQVPELSKSFPL